MRSLAADERALREALELGEAYRQQLAALDEQRAMLGGVIADYRRARESLAALDKVGAGEEVLLPLGGGAFVHATLANPGRVVSTLGAGVHAETPLADAIRRMEARIDSVAEAERRMAEESKRLEGELAELSRQVQAMAPGR